MSGSEDEFLKELRKIFAVEADEHLQTIVAGLIDIEKNRDPAEYQSTVEVIYRAAHSLKGASRSVNMTGIGIVCQSLESIFSALKKGSLTLGSGDFDTLHHTLDNISRLLASPRGENEEAFDLLLGPLERILKDRKKLSEEQNITPPKYPLSPPEPTFEPYSSLCGMEELLQGTGGNGSKQTTPEQLQAISPEGAYSAPVPEPLGIAETIRIEAAKLDSILLQAEELISIKLAGEQRISELQDILASFGPWKKEWEKGSERDGHTASKASLDWSYSRLLEVEAKLNGLKNALHSDLRTNGMLVDRLLEGTKTVLMLPFSTLLKAFPKMVRDIARRQNKEIELVFSGGEIKVDKRVLERIKDPLVHLIRNSIDHGIEETSLRLARSKPKAGTISISISQVEGTKIQVLVADDGNGIDPARVSENALNRGLISEDAAQGLDEQGALQLIFQSGVSVSEIITEISGRGLGMAIVKEAVDKLGGSIAIETRKEQGTTFRICLPLTLATFRGILVKEHEQIFTLPTSSVERVIRIKQTELRSVENRATIAVEDVPLPLARLGTVLGLDPVDRGGDEQPMLTIVILKSGQYRLALRVDKILNEQEILLKSLGKQLVRVPNISGAAVLGSGQVVLVLNVVDLMRSATLNTKTTPALPPAAKAAPKRKKVLVVEDSITSRTLFRNILVSAGFDVQAVVDGMEAWIALKERRFDLVISDVEMPRLNGFDLTAKIRGEAKFAELPVILVTSLASKQDRERGVDVGADAYITKNSFDQSDLLQIVRRLVG